MIIKELILGVLFPIVLGSCRSRYKVNAHLQLEGGWKYKVDDSIRFSKPGYNDSEWSEYTVDSSLEQQGYSRNNTFCWYRIKVFIASKLKERMRADDSIKIFLGRIGMYDQVFLNGAFIGQNNSAMPINTPVNDTFAGYSDIKSIPKVYFLPIKDKRILWDTINVISVRVFDRMAKRGVQYISIKGLEDYIRFNEDDFYKPDNKSGTVDTVLVVTNVSPGAFFNGTMDVSAENSLSKEKVYHNRFDIHLAPGNSGSYPVSLPVTTDITEFSIQYDDWDSNIMVRDSIEIPFIL